MNHWSYRLAVMTRFLEHFKQATACECQGFEIPLKSARNKTRSQQSVAEHGSSATDVAMKTSVGRDTCRVKREKSEKSTPSTSEKFISTQQRRGTDCSPFPTLFSFDSAIANFAERGEMRDKLFPPELSHAPC